MMYQQAAYDSLFSPEVVDYLQSVPYDICRDKLYTTEELLAGYDPSRPETFDQTPDHRIYQYFIDHSKDVSNPLELWAQSCHDVALMRVLNTVLKRYPTRKVVGIMGGHRLSRTSAYYLKIVKMAKQLTEMGWIVTSGGGPGAMEAVHLGAYLAERSDAEVDEAMSILSRADFFDHPQWLPSAVEVYRRFPLQSGKVSVAIPTWVFAREPHNVFATHSAKFFSNGIREDILITTAFGGILFLPGSAGTFREIFQDIVQNHYLLWDYPSPMIFIGKEYWTRTVPIFPVLRQMLETRQFRNLLTYLVDDESRVVDIIGDFQNLYPLIRAKQRGDRNIMDQFLVKKAPRP